MSRPVVGPACKKCGRPMVSRSRDLPNLTRMLGRPAGPDWFCVVHGPWPEPRDA